ncbi:MAG: TetR/AcrR family transcriptional regulator [Terracidiphilus sp.]
MPQTRSTKAHAKVVRAALELFGERGIEATSMDAIAQASGVSKATIYNHWVDKEALLMEVMLFVHGLDREHKEVDSGDVYRDLVTVLCGRPPGHLEAARNRITPTLIAYSASHQEFGKAWRHRVMEPARREVRRLLRRGMEQKLLRNDVNVELGVVLLLGPMLYSHIFREEGNAGNPDMGPAVVEAFWRGHKRSPRVP